ncbi:FUN14 family-domain-containing protein [Hyaloraphidium curvatum]|nr:FUN14 family-domain-containing protein [Hyaloraphidium curvatum]
MAAAAKSTEGGKGADATTVVGAGGLLGFATGYFFKKLGKMALFVTGAGVVAIQFLAHKGVVEVDWTKIGNSVEKALDSDGDGKLTHKDVTSELKKVVSFASYRMPWAAAFSVGFYAGIR